MARPAVAKDTIPGYSDIHRASYINDGLYGAGASWISNSAYSWIKIDFGKTTPTINTITFGQDRLGNYNDRDPGQFVIAVALHDDVYADGNSSNDFFEYTKVYDLKKAGFDGVVSGSETIQANFVPTEARYVKITFENPGTAIDEVEAFMVQPPSLVYIPTKIQKISATADLDSGSYRYIGANGYADSGPDGYTVANKYANSRIPPARQRMYLPARQRIYRPTRRVQRTRQQTCRPIRRVQPNTPTDVPTNTPTSNLYAYSIPNRHAIPHEYFRAPNQYSSTANQYRRANSCFHRHAIRADCTLVLSLCLK